MENTEEKKAPMGKIPVPSEKLKALQAAMDKIEKNYGKGAIMKMGDDHIDEIAVIPTGSIGLNAAFRCRRFSTRPCDRDLWSGIFW